MPPYSPPPSPSQLEKIPPKSPPSSSYFLYSPPTTKCSSPHHYQHSMKNFIFSCSCCSCHIFIFILYSLYTHVLLILNLIDVWYFQNNVCSFKKGPNVQNHCFSNSYHLIKNPPANFHIPLPLFKCPAEFRYSLRLELEFRQPSHPKLWVFYWLPLMNRAIGSTKMSHTWHSIIDVKWISFKYTGKETDKLLF